MTDKMGFNYYIIREGLVLVRVPAGCTDADVQDSVEFFDMRTGVQVREIYPRFQAEELDRGKLIAEEQAAAIIKSGMPLLGGPSVDLSKVVNILEVKQRRLDLVVADSILDQVKVIRDMFQDLLNVAAVARPEERFWLSQQVLTFLSKFSGRELNELQEVLDWLKKRPRK
ncbi:MAG: hypothetical protein LDL33_06610 [Desulfomonile sp.]|nr:hypothetical protein [Desulfomonile sp.]